MVERKDGRRLTACELQWHYLDAAKTYLKDREVSHWQVEVLERWEAVLALLEDDPLKAARTVDWATKYQLMQQIADRDGLEWEDAKLALVDLQYHDVHMDKGPTTGWPPPAGSSAWSPSRRSPPPWPSPPPTPGRSSAAAAWPATPQIAAAGWDAIIFDIGRETLQRVPMLEPTRGTAAHTAAVLDASPTAEDLIRNLQA